MGFASRYVQKIWDKGFLANLLRDDAHDVGFLHDQEILAIDTHLGAGPLAEEHAVAGLHVEGDDLAALVTGAGADGDDLAVSGMMMPPAVFSSASMRRTTTRSCSGRNFMELPL
jgi:hypothetical protein